jgi:hypothetical protein
MYILYFKVERIRSGIDDINASREEIQKLNSIILLLPRGKGGKYSCLMSRMWITPLRIANRSFNLNHWVMHPVARVSTNIYIE